MTADADENHHDRSGTIAEEEPASAPSARDAGHGAKERTRDGDRWPFEHRLAPHGTDGGIAASQAQDSRSELAAELAAVAPRLALDELQVRFGLTALEREVILVCAGFAMNPDLAKCYGPATLELVLKLHPRTALHLDVLTAQRPLRRYRLVESTGTGSVLFRSLRIDDRVLLALMGASGLDERLEDVLEPVAPATDLVPSHDQIAAAIVEAWQGERSAWPVIELWGPDAEAIRAIVAAACQRLGWPAYRLDLHALPRELGERELARLVSREARLAPAVFVLDARGVDPGDPGAHARLRRLADQIEAPIVLASRDRGRRLERRSIALEVPRPRMTEQRAVFHHALADEGVAAQPGVSRAVDRVIAQFDLGVPTIREVCAQVGRRGGGAPSGPGSVDRRGGAAAVDAGDGSVDGGAVATAVGAAHAASTDVDLGDALWDACRAQVRSHLDDLAQRSTARVGWSDLVLGEPQRRTLHELVARVRQRACVHDTWGFADRGGRGLGIAALFAGHSGTGKTLAAEVLASELRLDLYRIDLSQVVSKYIGETERNLGRVFDAAEDGGAVLLFDEADALFGKRSEVKDSHDRYANIEVGYLLQRMEAYRGLAILTTNMKTALDPAFLRRLAFVVEFPMPDEQASTAMWRSVFPARVPIAALDYAQLVRLGVSGGSIRNIALSAAFLAAEAGAPVGMTHVLSAARSELSKLGRSLPSDLARWL